MEKSAIKIANIINSCESALEPSAEWTLYWVKDYLAREHDLVLYPIVPDSE